MWNVWLLPPCGWGGVGHWRMATVNVLHENLLVVPKDRDMITHKSRLTYRFKCAHMSLEEEYIDESARTFWIGSRSTSGPPPPSITMVTPLVTASVLTISPQWVGTWTCSITRTIKEAIFIRANDPSLNRNIGKFQLPHIWDEVLQDTPVLHPR